MARRGRIRRLAGDHRLRSSPPAQLACRPHSPARLPGSRRSLGRRLNHVARVALVGAGLGIRRLWRGSAGRGGPARARPVALIVNADSPLPVHVDSDRITQVLTNLLGNALFATPAGGRVTVTARGTGSRGEVTVTDTGVGLDQGDVERVFERFYRAPGQARRSAGSGIGLTIARGIARGHHGDVTASRPGEDTGPASPSPCRYVHPPHQAPEPT